MINLYHSWYKFFNFLQKKNETIASEKKIHSNRKKKQNIIIKQKKIKKNIYIIYNIIILYIRYELKSSKTFQEFISRHNKIYDEIQK